MKHLKQLARLSTKIDPFKGFTDFASINSNRFENKVAVVTGCSNGIGRATAKLLTLSGISGLGLVDVDIERGYQLKKELEQIGGTKVLFIQADASKQEDVWNYMTTVEREFKSIDILINNCGVCLPGDGDQNTKVEVFWNTFAINLNSVFFGCKYAIPIMKKNQSKGSIVNISSFVARLGTATPHIAYTTSKGAIVSMTKSLAVMHAKDNIRVNVILPGPTYTRLTDHFKKNESEFQRRLVHAPMGRFARDVEIAQVIAFLASEESSYMNGCDLMADGGIHSAYTTAV